MSVSEAKQNNTSGNDCNHLFELTSVEWLYTDMFLIIPTQVKPKQRKSQKSCRRNIREDHTRTTMTTTNHKQRQTLSQTVPDSQSPIAKTCVSFSFCPMFELYGWSHWSLLQSGSHSSYCLDAPLYLHFPCCVTLLLPMFPQSPKGFLSHKIRVGSCWKQNDSCRSQKEVMWAEVRFLAEEKKAADHHWSLRVPWRDESHFPVYALY